jgi:S1-C subfamily serine protease
MRLPRTADLPLAGFPAALAAGLAAALLSAAPGGPPAFGAEAQLRGAAADHELAAAIKRVVPAYVFVGGGSGVAISADGYLLTNHHVAGRAKVWKVRQPDGKVWVADLVGTDPLGDVALLKMRGATDVPHVELGDSDAVRVGQTVIAIGNPFMLGMTDDAPTVTAGVVSATNRFHGNYTDAIQTDAPINPGNSGGPLMTVDGQLIGINGQIATRFGTRSNTGIGYAISINQIKRFLPALKAAEGGKVHHGTIGGLTLKAFNPNVGGEDKAVVETVLEGYTAAAAGFKPGDRIVSVDHYPVINYSRFGGVLGTYPAGAHVTVRVRRGSADVDIRVKLDVRPIPSPVDFGWTFERVNAQSVRKDGGIRIKAVREGGPADKAGLKAGDVLTEFNGIKPDEPSRVVALLRMGFEPGLPVKGRVTRREKDAGGEESSREIAFEISPDKARRADWGLEWRFDQVAGGLVVLSVTERGPADRAGIKAGDVVTELNGTKLGGVPQVTRVLALIKPGHTVKGKLKRTVFEGEDQVEKVIDFTVKVGSTR